MRALVVFSVILFTFVAVDMAVAKPRAVEPGAEAERWAGVGILQVSGGGFCSAALMDQQTVLTAAHCVYPGDDRRLADPVDVTFHAGWRDGITAAKRQAVRITAHRGYDPASDYNQANIAADLAIVELDRPVDMGAAEAFGQIDKVRIGEPVAVVSFSGRRSDVASIEDDCAVTERRGDILMLSCEAHPGMSGAPIFSFVNGKPQIVALISGNRTNPQTGENHGIALAVGNPLGRVEVDAKATRTTPREALPYWTKRDRSQANTGAAIATRKSIRAGSGLSAITGSGNARKVVRPPSAIN